MVMTAIIVMCLCINGIVMGQVMVFPPSYNDTPVDQACTQVTRQPAIMYNLHVGEEDRDIYRS